MNTKTSVSTRNVESLRSCCIHVTYYCYLCRTLSFSPFLYLNLSCSLFLSLSFSFSFSFSFSLSLVRAHIFSDTLPLPMSLAVSEFFLSWSIRRSLPNHIAHAETLFLNNFFVSPHAHVNMHLDPSWLIQSVQIWHQALDYDLSRTQTDWIYEVSHLSLWVEPCGGI